MNQEFNSDFRGRTPNQIVDADGTVYKSVRTLARKIGVHHSKITRAIRRNGLFKWDGVEYRLKPYDGKQDNSHGNKPSHKKNTVEISREEYKDLDEYRHYKEQLKAVNELTFNHYDFSRSDREPGRRYAVALFSDAHIEETVKPETVIGLNEYSLDIARERVKNYFVNLVSCLNEDKVEELLFAALGDLMSGHIHPELEQENSLSPLQCVYEGQNLLYNGLKYICDNTNLKRIKFIGIVGNHGRTTKKIQHSNGYAMSYEWLLYKNVEKECMLTNLPIEFCIPNSEMAVVDMPDKKRFIFIHGFQIKGTHNGTVCGIYPALNRLTLKYGKVFKQDKVYLGHFHSCTSIPNAVVNGSIIGYNSFALTNGFSYEEPAQMYECYDDKTGLLLTRQIYCR